MIKYVIRKIEETLTDSINTISMETAPNKMMQFENGEIKINSIKFTNNKPLSVIAIIGKARTGKSTFLNCMISYLTKNDSVVFQTSDKDEHCTHGCDTFLLELTDKQILIIDVQGIEYHDSSIDSKLLLFIYLIADVIILNEKMMISNSTLNSLQPVATFASCLELDNFSKPSIIFRVADVDLDIDAQENLEKTLVHRDDQYQNIRETLKTLFNNLTAYKTEPLDRTEKALLKDKKYYQFIQNKENRFESVIYDILYHSLKSNKFKANEYNDILQTVSALINTNQKIDWNKLDITKQIAKSEIMEWIQENIEPSHYNNIIVDGTQNQYDTLVEPMIKYRVKILNSFDKRFEKAPPQIKELYRTDISNKLSVPIEDAINQTVQKANERLLEHLDNRLKTITGIYKFTSTTFSIAYNTLNKIQGQITQSICDLHMYKPSELKAISRLNEIITDSENKVKEEEGKFIQYLDEYKESLIEIYETLYEPKIFDELSKELHNITLSFENISNNLIDNFDKFLMSRKIAIGNYQITYRGYKHSIKRNDILELSYNHELLQNLGLSFIDVMKDEYLVKVKSCEETFNQMRKDNLQTFLNKIKNKNYNDANEMIKVISLAGNNVRMLDLSFLENTNSFEFIRKYYDIYKIFTSEEFEKYYPEKAVRYYNKLDKIEPEFKNIVINKIKDILIEDILENKV